MTLYPHLYNCRNPKSVRYQPIADRLWDGVKAVLGSEDGLRTAIQSRVEYVAQKRQAIETQLYELSRKLTNLEDERDIVVTTFRKGLYDEERLQHQLDAIEEEEQQYKSEIDSLLADMRLQSDSQTVYQQARHLIPMIRKKLDTNLSDKEKQEIIKLLVKRALLNRFGDLNIEFRVPVPSDFTSSTAPHVGLPGYRLHYGSARVPASHWT